MRWGPAQTFSKLPSYWACLELSFILPFLSHVFSMWWHLLHFESYILIMGGWEWSLCWVLALNRKYGQGLPSLSTLALGVVDDGLLFRHCDSCPWTKHNFGAVTTSALSMIGYSYILGSIPSGLALPQWWHPWVMLFQLFRGWANGSQEPLNFISTSLLSHKRLIFFLQVLLSIETGEESLSVDTVLCFGCFTGQTMWSLVHSWGLANGLLLNGWGTRHVMTRTYAIDFLKRSGIPHFIFWSFIEEIMTLAYWRGKPWYSRLRLICNLLSTGGLKPLSGLPQTSPGLAWGQGPQCYWPSSAES